MEVGKTKSVGYQVGVRRTLPLPLEEAWEMIVSPFTVGLIRIIMWVGRYLHTLLRFSGIYLDT